MTPEYVRLMAEYGAEMNRRLYAGAARLSDDALRGERGAFWGGVMGTLNHLLWGDRQWMSRFAGWPANGVGIRQSATLYDDFGALRAARVQADEAICAWARGLSPDWLEGELVWFSGASGREERRAKRMLVVHFFNHATHHRGQVHCLLTQAGIDPGDTDLFLVVP